MKKSSLQFLAELEENNNKPWFDEHNDAYTAAKQDFLSLVAEVLGTFQQTDTTLNQVVPKNTLFRINRDIRFSKNKAPYKNNFGSSVNASGRMGNLAGYYIHLQPNGNSFCGGGMWNPEAAELAKVRQEIDYNYSEFLSIVEDKNFKKYFGELDRSEGFALKREPKGYEKDNPAIEFLKLKYFVGRHPLTDKTITSEKAAEEIIQTFAAIFPLIRFLNRAILD